MPTIADYIALRDTTFTLEADDERTLSFNLPSDFFSSSGNSRVVLSFQVDPSGPAPKNFEVDVNDTRARRLVTRSGEPRVLQEIINGDKFEVGSNTVQFRMERGPGSLRISDIVVMFQRQI